VATFTEYVKIIMVLVSWKLGETGLKSEKHKKLRTQNVRGS
jgi:hypothetical protein